jgi:hypothetical protein
MKIKEIIRYNIFCFTSLSIYLVACYVLSKVSQQSFLGAPIYWIGIFDNPFHSIISGFAILTGISLIYLIPGIFIVYYFSKKEDSLTLIAIKGFLCNYFIYFLVLLFVKLGFGIAIDRKIFLTVILIFIVFGNIMFIFNRDRIINISTPFYRRIDYKLFFLYSVFIIFVFFISWKKIFISVFSFDGLEQYWLAHSLKDFILPSSYGGVEFSLIPQFSFSPSVYLNLFSLLLFGDTEFVMRISIIVAYVCIAVLLKKFIERVRDNERISLIQWLPLCLYLTMYFLLIAFRADYEWVVDLAKSNETVQAAIFLSGIYILFISKHNKYILSGILFVLASMIRYNGFLAISFFIIIYSAVFRKFKCLFVYSIGCLIVVLVAYVFLIGKVCLFSEMVYAIYQNQKENFLLSFDYIFLFRYLWNYIVFTGGAFVFLFLGLRNKYTLIMLFSSFCTYVCRLFITVCLLIFLLQ